MEKVYHLSALRDPDTLLRLEQLAILQAARKTLSARIGKLWHTLSNLLPKNEKQPEPRQPRRYRPRFGRRSYDLCEND